MSYQMAATAVTFSDIQGHSQIVCFIKIVFSLLHTMLVVDKHCSKVCCDEFSVPQVDRRSKQAEEQ